MGAPHHFRRWITTADGLAISYRSNRATRQGGINTLNGLGLSGRNKAAHAPDQGGRNRDDRNNSSTPEHFKRGIILPTHHQRGQDQENHGPKRPKSPDNTLCQNTCAGQRHRQVQMLHFVRLILQRFSPVGAVSLTTLVPYRVQSFLHR